MARQVAEAADWMARHLGKVIADRDAVDLTNQGFLQQYAIVFAASTVLVLILWLLAVTKRAVRGVPMLTAMGEAVGLLWLAVLATAFTPLILYTVVSATSAVSDALQSAFGGSPGSTYEALADDLEAGRVGGGPLMLALVSLAAIMLCGALWLLLVLRALGLYVGALLGVVVYAGLVDKDMWGKVRRWGGFMTMLILVEPVIVIVLGFASALETSEDTSAVSMGLAVTVIALGAAIYIVVKFPGFTDSVKVAREVGRTAGLGGRAKVGAASPAQGIRHGISTHSVRTGSTTGSTSSGDGGRRVNGQSKAAEGITTHAHRKPRPDSGGGTSSTDRK
ncbi:hypothetical protein [Streptomyces palmae]|uniref:Type IV secretion system protein n=1 Tax=Streptomyces palmae TaxID=1701085 RepID=A0A4Z0FVZ2_9ACTN|nr:hypothetical protein [Streptomyces palmae]TGA85753.1 hypothetical protein E4099_30735 [Streptomyces palmae]